MNLAVMTARFMSCHVMWNSLNQDKVRHCVFSDNVKLKVFKRIGLFTSKKRLSLSWRISRSINNLGYGLTPLLLPQPISTKCCRFAMLDQLVRLMGNSIFHSIFRSFLVFFLLAPYILLAHDHSLALYLQDTMPMTGAFTEKVLVRIHLPFHGTTFPDSEC